MRAGDHERALAHYRAAAARPTSIPERDYLLTRAARVAARRKEARTSDEDRGSGG
jgi:hypothetical protein